MKKESKCGKENETILQKKPGLGLRPQVRALKVTVYVLFILSFQLKNDVWNYETYKTKEGIRLVRTPPSGPTAPQLADAPEAGRRARMPLALPLPTSHRASARTRSSDGRLRKRKME